MRELRTVSKVIINGLETIEVRVPLAELPRDPGTLILFDFGRGELVLQVFSIGEMMERNHRREMAGILKD